MSLTYIEGPAGSGKTTRLFALLSSTLDARPMLSHQKALALTMMHGSRRRLQDRLDSLPGLRSYECSTIAKFAWRIVKRWRSLARKISPEQPEELSYGETYAMAGELLARPSVAGWVSLTYPIIVIDELQDCDWSQLSLIRGLSTCCTCLAAADEFQDLDAKGENLAVTWARNHGEVESLSGNHRTSKIGLLNAANALRSGRPVADRGAGFKLLEAFNHNHAAAFVSNNLTWWNDAPNIAIITPVGPDRAPFVRNLVDRVAAGPIGENECGPFRIPWESTRVHECATVITSLGLPEDRSDLVTPQGLTLNAVDPIVEGLKQWFHSQRKTCGRTCFKVDEVEGQVMRIHQRLRAHRRGLTRGFCGMSIHQAKNREFDSVIVLWPYQVQGDAERKRRLLYNAITRAQRQAVVIVQGKGSLQKAPFV